MNCPNFLNFFSTNFSGSSNSLERVGGFCFCPCVVHSSFWTNKVIRFFYQYLLEHCKSIFCSGGCLFCFYCFLTTSLILLWLSNIQQASNQWLNLVELMGDSGTWGDWQSLLMLLLLNIAQLLSNCNLVGGHGWYPMSSLGFSTTDWHTWFFFLFMVAWP